jgi:hypothetical protein
MGGGGCTGLSTANEYIKKTVYVHGAKINFGDLTSYLTYGNNITRDLVATIPFFIFSEKFM